MTQGRTLDETMGHLQEAVSLYLEGDDLEAMGLAPNPTILATIGLEEDQPMPKTVYVLQYMSWLGYPADFIFEDGEHCPEDRLVKALYTSPEAAFKDNPEEQFEQAFEDPSAQIWFSIVDDDNADRQLILLIGAVCR